MKKLTLFSSILFLIIFITITKNSTKKLEIEIYNTKENIRSLKHEYEMVLLDFNYLSSPGKLLEYQSKYFENDLKEIDIKKLNKIKIKENIINVEEFLISK